MTREDFVSQIELLAALTTIEVHSSDPVLRTAASAWRQIAEQLTQQVERADVRCLAWVTPSLLVRFLMNRNRPVREIAVMLTLRTYRCG